mgnify:CR=1 FL=1
MHHPWVHHNQYPICRVDDVISVLFPFFGILQYVVETTSNSLADILVCFVAVVRTYFLARTLCINHGSVQFSSLLFKVSALVSTCKINKYLSIFLVHARQKISFTLYRG